MDVRGVQCVKGIKSELESAVLAGYEVGPPESKRVAFRFLDVYNGGGTGPTK